MIQFVLVKMCLILLCPILLVAAVQTLSIDSELGTSVEDCFERYSIGDQLSNKAIYRNESELMIRECEQLCKQDKQCQTYDYGVGAKGNATCNLSSRSENQLKEDNILLRHTDYDVYVRRFHCERSPPIPIEPLFDEDGHLQRPAFKPRDPDSKKPLSDMPFDDIPHNRRPSRPNSNERPDDIYSSSPEFDSFPVYGDLRPLDMPYIRPLPNMSGLKPDPYDVLHLKGSYGRPRPEEPNRWRPDPEYPPMTDNSPEGYGSRPSTLNKPNDRPEYYYILRPNRRQKPLHPENDSGYGNRPNNPPDTGYGLDSSHPSGPTGPPERPNRPSNNYDSDNSVHVEIYDPPNRQKPTHSGCNELCYIPYDDGSNYNSHSTGNSNGQSDYYGSSNEYNKGYGNRPRPEKPIGPSTGYDRPTSTYGPGASYGQSSSYGSQLSSQSSSNSYSNSETSYQSYGGGGIQSYGPSSESNSGSRPSNGLYDRPSHSYGSKGQSYDSASQFYGDEGYSSGGSSYGQENFKDKGSYGGSQLYGDRNSYNQNKGSYGNQDKYAAKGGYGGSSQVYGDDSFDKGSYSSSSYGSQLSSSISQNGYGSSQSTLGSRPSYSSQGAYGSSSDRDEGYGGSQLSYNSKRKRPAYDINDGYGSNVASYGNSQASYGSNQASYGNQASYESNQASYGSNQASYGSNQASYGSNQASYENNKGSYGTNQVSYGSSQGSYGNNQGVYGSNQFSSSYGGSQSYGSNSYGNQEQRPYDNRPYKGENYGTNQENFNNYNKRPYDQNKFKPNSSTDYKPVYEYELEPNNGLGKPTLVISNPVSVSDYGGKGAKKDNYEACFRRVLAGRRALRSFVRRVLTCERLEDCRMECATEKRFPCESFNYRLDPLLRGKGLCELMTKPIEAFDLRRDFVDDRDYDFYELDRNSLEPNCPVTLRGPGLLHSGFLSSNSADGYGLQGQRDRWTDRSDWQGSREVDYNRYYNDRRSSGYNRRYEDRFYVPYQIGLSRSNDDDYDSWGQYGGYYGGYDYYKNKFDYHKSLNHWKLHDDREQSHYYGVKPYRPYNDNSFNYFSLGRKDRNLSYGSNSWRRERWNTSGSWSTGLEYGESSIYKPVTHGHEIIDRSDEVVEKDCSSRRRAGMSLGTGSIRRSLLAHNVVECETSCFNERGFKCVSYSFKYSNSHGSDNCYLSELPYRGLDLSSDTGSDVYVMPEDHGCTTISYKPWVESECFWHVRSGARVAGGGVKAALSVAGLGACEAECIRATTFFCRGFSFRFDSPTIGDDIENCVLTSTPPTSLDVRSGLRSISGHELYSRGNYGRGCEPALYDDLHPKETQCYLQYDKSARLIGSAVRGQARVRDETACGVACTEAPFRCLSYSFSNTAPRGTDNCLLSEIRLFDLQRGVDYEHSTDDWLFAFDLFNGQCWRKANGKTRTNPTYELPHPLRPVPVPVYPDSGPSGPTGPSGPSGSGYIPAPPPDPPYIPSGPPSGPYRPGYPDDGAIYKPGYQPEYHYKPGYIPIEKPGFIPAGLPPRPTGPGLKPAYLPGPSRPQYRPGDKPLFTGDNSIEEPIIGSLRHYTVSGFPCRKGTTCAQNQIAGHWACEPEGGEIGSWDYCCAPSHRCGYSEGFHKPWCYVGTSEDQWRPCSDKYYPYHQHNVPHPSLGNRDTKPINRPWQSHNKDRPYRGPYLSDTDKKYWDELYKDGPQAYYDKYGNPLPGYARVPTEGRPYIKYHYNLPPSATGQWLPVSALHEEDKEPNVPGGLGAPRYWPVAYLHKSPPPNMTYFKYNETPSTTEKYNTPKTPTIILPTPITNSDKPEYRVSDINLPDSIVPDDESKSRRDEKPRFLGDTDTNFYNIDNSMKTQSTTSTTTTTTTSTPEVDETNTQVEGRATNVTDMNIRMPEIMKDDNETVFIRGISGKLGDFDSIEVFDIEDAKRDKSSEFRTAEAEERQIEAIGRLLASRREGKLLIEKRSEKDLESQHIAVDNNMEDFNFGNKFPSSERRGYIQKVTKEEIENERNKNDKSLEVSETTYVRPPRVLSTTENIRKVNVNGKVFYDATIREQRDLNSTRKSRNFRHLDDIKAPSVINNASFGKKKVIRARNVNPVRRVKRVYKKKYNPEEVRRRLLERERNMKEHKE